MTHVVDFFSSLLSAKPESEFVIAPSFWNADEKIPLRRTMPC
jgi:hypothetical protein